MSQISFKIPSGIRWTALTSSPDYTNVIFDAINFDHSMKTFMNQMIQRKAATLTEKGDIDTSYVLVIGDQECAEKIPSSLLGEVLLDGKKLRMSFICVGVTLPHSIDRQVVELPFMEIVEKMQHMTRGDLLIRHLAAHASQFGNRTLAKAFTEPLPESKDHVLEIAQLVDKDVCAEWIVLRLMDIGYVRSEKLASIAKSNGWNQVLYLLGKQPSGRSKAFEEACYDLLHGRPYKGGVTNPIEIGEVLLMAVGKPCFESVANSLMCIPEKVLRMVIELNSTTDFVSIRDKPVYSEHPGSCDSAVSCGKESLRKFGRFEILRLIRVEQRLNWLGQDQSDVRLLKKSIVSGQSDLLARCIFKSPKHQAFLDALDFSEVTLRPDVPVEYLELVIKNHFQPQMLLTPYAKIRDTLWDLFYKYDLTIDGKVPTRNALIICTDGQIFMNRSVLAFHVDDPWVRALKVPATMQQIGDPTFVWPKFTDASSEPRIVSSGPQPELSSERSSECKTNLTTALSRLTARIEAINHMDLSDKAKDELARTFLTTCHSDWDPSGEVRALFSKKLD